MGDLTNLLNYFLEKESFPTDLKIVDFSPLSKKNNNLYKENYRPAGILPACQKLTKSYLQTN